MKREEFFEALSDIDENMVASANQSEEALAPMIVTPKKTYVRPICTAAACIALAAAVIAAAVSMSLRPDSVISPNTQEKGYKTTVNLVNMSRYPDSLYLYTGDYSKLDMHYMGDNLPDFVSASKYKSYEELAEDSSLIVMGTFTDQSRQVAETNKIPDFVESISADYYNGFMSFNTLKVEKVLKGNGKAWEGDEIVIAMPYTVGDYDPAEDEGGFYSFSQLTPMIMGDSWVYFLKDAPSYPEEIYGYNAYCPVNDYEGRYPVPGRENASFEYRENTNGVVAPAVFNESVYSELEERLAAAVTEKRPPYEIEYKKVVDIAKELDLKSVYSANIAIEFEMGEFEGKVFGIENGRLYVRTPGASEERSYLAGGTGVYVNPGATYLCDLSGDGKREICTEISFGSGLVNNLIWVLDYAEDKMYFLSDRGKYDYFLQERNGELEYKYCVSYMQSGYYSDDFSADILTLDKMTEYSLKDESENDPVSEPESSEKVIKIRDLTVSGDGSLWDIPLEFDMEDFPGILFTYDPDDVNGTGLYVKEGDASRPLFRCKSITSIYLCDLNKDGKLEICAGICLSQKGEPEISSRSIVVIDYSNNCAYCLSDEKNYHYSLGKKDDVLYFSKSDAKTGDLLSSEPLALDVMDQVMAGNHAQFILPQS